MTDDRLGKIFLSAFVVSTAAISVAAIIPGQDHPAEKVAQVIGLAAATVMMAFILLTLALLIWDGISELIKRR